MQITCRVFQFKIKEGLLIKVTYLPTNKLQDVPKNVVLVLYSRCACVSSPPYNFGVGF